MARPRIWIGDKMAMAKRLILERVTGGENMATVCKDVGMPHRDTVLQWIYEDEGFSVALAQARLESAHAMIAEADAALKAAKPGEKVDTAILRETLHHLRWKASKLNPNAYGDRQQVQMKAEIADSRPSQAAPEWLAPKVAPSQPATPAAPTISPGEEDSEAPATRH